MKYKFYSPIKGIIDYSDNCALDYESYFDEEAIEDLDYISFNYLNQRELSFYEEIINISIKNSLDYKNDEGKGLMHYFGYGDDDIELLEKVKSAYPKIETIGDNAYGVMECEISEKLNDYDIKKLKKYFGGQYSDGWGEGFEQQGIKTREGTIYLSFWPDNFYIDTEEEFENRLNEEMENSIDFINFDM